MFEQNVIHIRAPAQLSLLDACGNPVRSFVRHLGTSSSFVTYQAFLIEGNRLGFRCTRIPRTRPARWAAYRFPPSGPARYLYSEKVGGVFAVLMARINAVATRRDGPSSANQDDNHGRQCLGPSRHHRRRKGESNPQRNALNFPHHEI